MLGARSLVSRLGRLMDDERGVPWYARSWATFVAMYAFFPLGLYLMWRYKDWPASIKAAVTVAGLSLAAVATFLSSTYVMPRLF